MPEPHAMVLRSPLSAPHVAGRQLLRLLVSEPAPAAREPGPEAGEVVLLAGGKSGGHVFPALALVGELEARGLRAEWVGNAGGMEERLATRHGLAFHPLAAAPLRGRGPLQRLRALYVLLGSIVAAWRLVGRTEAAAVVGTGGFVSAPAAIGAWLRRKPLLLLEPNAEAGLANRWLSRLASVAVVAAESAGSGLRCRLLAAGVPVRAEFFTVPEPRFEDDDNGSRRLLVLGGSQGAERLNRSIPAALLHLRSPVAVLHQTGAANLEATAAVYRSTFETGPPDPETGALRFRRQGIEVELRAFVDDVPREMARCQLLVSRAGAVTLAEICAAGRGSLLVPLPIAAGHQGANARALERAGAAVVLEESELDLLAGRLGELLDDQARLLSMARRARSMARRDASERIADEVRSLARRSRAGRRR